MRLKNEKWHLGIVLASYLIRVWNQFCATWYEFGINLDMDLASYNKDYRNPEQTLIKNTENESKMAKTVVFLTKKQATVLCLITDQRSGCF